MNGSIKLDYRPGNGVFTVTNNGGKDTAKFLQDHRKFFNTMPCDNNWVLMYWLEPKRIGKFKLYARSKGFEVVMGR